MRRGALVVLFLLHFAAGASGKPTDKPAKSTSTDNLNTRMFSKNIPGSDPPNFPDRSASTTSASGTLGHSSVSSPSAITSSVTTTSSPMPISPSPSLPSMVPSSSDYSKSTPASSSSSPVFSSSAGTYDDGPPTSPPPPVSTPSPAVSAPSSSTSGSPPPPILASAKSNKTSSIAAGVVVPIVGLALAAAGLVLFKRRRRTRDRLEWERTHKEIADAVRKAGATGTAGSAASGSGWSRMELVSRPASGTDGQTSMRGVMGGDSSMDRPFSDYAAPPLPASWRGPEYSAAADRSPPESPEPGFYRDEPEPEPGPESRPASPRGSAVHVDSFIGHHASAL